MAGVRSSLSRRRPRRLRSAISTLVTAGLVAGVTIGAPPRSYAAEPGVAQLLAVLGHGGDPTRNLATWTQGLGGVDKLGEPLPLVQATPGALLGFEDLFAKAVTDELAAANTFADLVKTDAQITIDEGRSGKLTTKVEPEGDGKRLTIVATVARQVDGRSLHVTNGQPKVDLTVSGVKVDVTARLALSVVWTGPTDNQVYVVSGAGGPRVDVDAHASVNGATAKAAVGILGVSLTGSSLDLDAHLVGTVADPDNDGRLSFADELAQDGSLAGLFTIGLDELGSETDPGSRGSVHAEFKLGATEAADGLSLPGTINATVKVDWDDIGTGSPTVTAPGLEETVGKFQNLSMGDLASGLAQVAVALTGVQQKEWAGQGDLDLPFMRGKLSDAVKVGEKLQKFLTDNSVVSGEGVTAPTFTSLQDLLKELEAEAGFSLGTLDWDQLASKLLVPLSIKRTAPPSPVDLDAVSALVSGAGATYGEKTLEVGGTPFKDPVSGEVMKLAGRSVSAGTSYGTVASNTVNSVTLVQPWTGGTPGGSTPWIVSGAEPHVGAVQFGNLLRTGVTQGDDGRGLLNANADQTLAKVAPSYDVTLPLVLDLQDPKSGAGCATFEGNTQACPYDVQNEGLAYHVEELPLDTDRVLIRTGQNLFKARFPISSEIDLTANAGFVKTRITGQLKFCHPSQGTACDQAATGDMLSVGLKSLGDLRMSQFFDKLAKDPGSLLDVKLEARASATAKVGIVGSETFFPQGTTANFTASWASTDPENLSVSTSDLSEIFGLDFDTADPKALFAIVIKQLQSLTTELGNANPGAGGGVFDKDIPGVGQSLRELFAADQANGGAGVSYAGDNAHGTLTDTSRPTDKAAAGAFTDALIGRTVIVGTRVAIVDQVPSGRTLRMASGWDGAPVPGTPYAMRSALADGVDRLLAAPPDNLQDAVRVLNEVLGTSAVKFRYLGGGTPSLVLDVDWARKYRVGSPVRLDLGAVGTFAGVSSSAQAHADVDAAVKTGVVLPLSTTAGDLKVMEDSSLSVKVNAGLAGVVEGVIGPLSVALGKDGDLAKADARLSLLLAKGGAAKDNPVSFGSFLSGVGATFNGDPGTANCNESLSTELMLCAHLPIYVNGAGLGAIKVRLPKTTDPAKLTDLSGNLPAPDEAKQKLEVPDLSAAFANLVLDFGNFDDGIDAYLQRIEQALQLASFDGKVPLVGEDLQQGADFVGTIRKTINDEFGSLATQPTAEAFETFVNGQLTTALKNAGINATAAISSDCTKTLDPVTTLSVSPTKVDPGEGETPPDGGTGSWAYKVVAFQGDGNGYANDTLDGNEASATNWVALGYKDSTNNLSWQAVTGAKGYKVLRKAPGATAWKEIAKVTGTTYPDKTPGDIGTSYNIDQVTEAPKLNPCPTEFRDKWFLTLDLQKGNISAQGCEDPANATDQTKCLTETVPLDIGIPGLALRQGTDSEGIKAQLGYQIHLKLGLDRKDGLFIATRDGWRGGKAAPEFQVGADFDLPQSMVAQLAFIDVGVKKLDNAPVAAAAFQLDLRSGSDEPACFGDCAKDDAKVLKFADIGSKPLADLVPFKASAAINLHWALEATVDSALPGIRADFLLDWDIDSTNLQNMGAPTIKFDKVGILAGSFFKGVLGDVVKTMKDVTEPVQPVVDTLYAPIPVLSDLSRMAGGGDVTLITLAKAYTTLQDGPDLEFVDTIKALIDFINRLPDCTSAPPPGQPDPCFIGLGSFELLGSKALDTANSPATADSMFDMGKTTAKTGAQVKSALDGANTASDKALFGTDGDTTKSGFTFPILDEPMKAFSVLMGGDVDLVKFDSGPLEIGFTWRQDFGPVYAPPPVVITLAGSASATLQIRAGLDTYGLRKTVEDIRAGKDINGVTLLNGLYFASVDEAGNPAPVLTLTGEIAAGAAVTALIVKVGIEGGLRLTIKFYWNDPNDDGKFRILEIGQAVLNNPVCLFRMDGELSLFLRLVITIGFSPFDASFAIELANFKLLDFSVQPDCEPDPPKLGKKSGDTLVVFAGNLGDSAQRGDPVWDKDEYDEDSVKVIALHYAQTKDDPAGADPGFDGVAVEALGHREEFMDTGLKRVVIDASNSSVPLVASFIGDGEKKGELDQANAGKQPTQFDLIAVVRGSSKDDRINTGIGNSNVDGRGGKDTIVTMDGAHKRPDGSDLVSRAWVAGGGGDDTIRTGNGDDKVAGDAHVGTETIAFEGATVIDWGKLVDPTTVNTDPTGVGGDTISVGLGKNHVRGNGGDDKIGVAADQPGDKLKAKRNVLVGDLGADNIAGGSNDDEIFTSSEVRFADFEANPPTGVDGLGPVDDNTKPNVVDTGAGADRVWGGTKVDLVTSHSATNQTTKIAGGDGDDVLIGGYGTDEVYGGPGDDYVIAEPATVSDLLTNPARHTIDGRDYGPRRTVTEQPLPPNTAPSAKMLVGGLGNDHVIGGDGPSTVFGDKRIDAEKCVPGNPVESDPVGESTSVDTGDGNDLVEGGAGVDTVSAGGAADVVRTYADLDLLCGQQGNDTLHGGADADKSWGGTDADLSYGEGGTDSVYGNAGRDTSYGGGDADVLEGNNGPDWLSGGTESDTVYGGTRAEGRNDTDTAGPGGAAAGDDLYGDAGEDTLVGDNGTVLAPYPYDLSGTPAAAGAGDRLHGGADDDKAYGGLGNDVVNGNAGDDVLEGNNGSDTVHGNADEDRIIGGSSQEASAGVGRPDTGDWLYGDDDADLVTGDNAVLEVGAEADATRVTRERGFALFHQVGLLDLGLTPTAGTSGGDYVEGGGADDVIYGQDGPDRVKGNDGEDYAEGGPGVDWLEGNAHDDDLVGGSSTPLSGVGADASGQPDAADAVHGGPGDDVALGDNGHLLRPLDDEDPTAVTERLGSSAGDVMTPRIVQAFDRRTGGSVLNAPATDRFGADRLSGGADVDVLFGQDGADQVSGGSAGDYVEGNGDADVLRGDLPLDAASPYTTTSPLTDAAWPGDPSGAAQLTGATSPDGQDDLVGGTSTRRYRDSGDTFEGNGGDDVVLGDNGTLLRTLQGDPGSLRERIYADRYANGAAPDDATRSRVHDPDAGDDATRFCSEAQATCEVSGAYGDDTVYGNDGDDGIWGQDGDDVLYGGSDDDDMYGELGDDRMFGEAGEDAMLGDRGGVVNERLDDGDEPSQFTVTLSQVPQETHTGFRRGHYDRRVDLLHDVDGDEWVGSSTSAAMPHDGITTGGRDWIRGGPDADNVHAGFGDDLANGDSGGDRVFGGDGEDALWGGKGCDPVTDATTPDCLTNGVFDSTSRGEKDRFLDHVFGGVGEVPGETANLNGSDIIDWNPRGSYAPGTGCAAGDWPTSTGSKKDTVWIDPCVWFEMTEKHDAEAANNQHHHGTDWIYGGWDRDVMQANVAGNGPNPGDRLIDWTGAYNLYTHCNASYGGYNDLRLMAPDLLDFLNGLAWVDGAGRSKSDVLTKGTSAYRELALTYNPDFKLHGNGQAYPTTPGHFEDPTACEG